MRTCEECGARMQPFVARKLVDQRRVCQKCAASRTAGIKNLAALENPIADRTKKHPEEWYHGSPGDFEHFGDPADLQDLNVEGELDEYKHWNTLLGNHFTSDHQVAKDFAGGKHDARDEDDDEPLSHVIHAKLHLKNPKVYKSEHDMDQEVYEHEWGEGNHHDKTMASPPEDDDEYEEWAEDYGSRRHYAGDSQHKYSKEEPDPGYAYSFHPKATGWLNTHPDKEGIARRYKDRLKRAGYDGIVYGNEFENSDHGRAAKSAIAFEPHQIEITQHHYGKEGCLTPDEAKRRTVHPGQIPLPGMEEMQRRLPRDRPVDTSRDWPRTWTPSFFGPNRHYPTTHVSVLASRQGFDTGRLWAPLPQECWDRYYGRHTGSQRRTGKSWTMKYMTYAPEGGYVDKEREVEGPLYHGSRSKRLVEGDHITPGRKTNPWGDEGNKSQHVFFTTELRTAADYARDAGGHVYEVEPTGEFSSDYSAGDYKTKHPLKVVRKLDHSEWQSDRTASRSVADDPSRWEHRQRDWDRRRPEIERVHDRGWYDLHVEPPYDDGDLQMHAVTKDGNYIGEAYFGEHPFERGRIEGAPEVHPDYRRRGIGTSMYDLAEEMTGKKAAPARYNTDYAKAFWKTRKTSALGEESARHEEGKQDVYAVRSGDSMINLCKYHAETHVRNRQAADDLGSQVGLSGRERSAEMLGQPRKGRCSACGKDTAQQLKMMTPMWVRNADAATAQGDRPRPARRKDKPLRTKPLPSLRQSENARDEDDHHFASRRPALPTLAEKEHVQMTATRLPSLRMLAHDATEVHYDSAVTPIHKHAHDATENQAIRHCPFCGGGKIIGRADGSVECEFCFSGETEFVTWDGIKTFKETVGTVQRVLTSQTGMVQTGKGRSRRGNPSLSDEQVVEIRDLYAQGDVTKAELGRRFGVVQGTIKKIVERISHRHLGGGGVDPSEPPLRDATWGQGHGTFGGVWVDAEIKSFGVQPLLKVVLQRNGVEKIVHATAEHRWYVHPPHGTAFKTDQKQVVITADLKNGDRLAALLPKDRLRQNKPTVPSPFGIAHGFTFGDGCLTGRGGSQVTLWGDKDTALLPYFAASRRRELANANGTPGIEIKDLPAFFKDMPSKGESLSYLYGWLAGYFAADGSVGQAGNPILHCADRGVLEQVQALCIRLGIGTYNIGRTSRTGLGQGEPSDLWSLSLVAQTLTEDFFLIPAHRERFLNRSGRAPALGWIVVSVEATDREEEVYCAVVPGSHNFTLAGDINVMNCHNYFTVQIQPQYPNFPQTINGMPQDIPGMPGQVETPGAAPGMDAGGFPPGEEGEDTGDAPPWAQDDAEGAPDDEGDEGEEEEPPPFAKKSFRTATGALLAEEDYVRHLAIRLAPDRDAMIARIREERGVK